MLRKTISYIHILVACSVCFVAGCGGGSGNDKVLRIGVLKETTGDVSSFGPTLALSLTLEIGLSILGMFVVMAFSRHREFRADAGSAKFVGANKMIAGLEALQRYFGKIEEEEAPKSIATLKISGHKSWFKLFSSHPPLSERIKALQTMQYR